MATDRKINIQLEDLMWMLSRVQWCQQLASLHQVLPVKQEDLNN
jgi:hypothetical protein